jgi:putative peptide zinc metalloprotease protein
MADCTVSEFPELRPHLERRETGSVVLGTVDGRVHLSLTFEESRFLDRLDGQTSRPVLADDFDGNFEEFLVDLSQAGFLKGMDPAPEQRVSLTSAGLEFAGFDRFVAGSYRLAGRYLATRTFLVLAALLVAVGLSFTLAQPPVRSGSASAWALLILASGSIATGFCHELGHALVIHHYGRRVGRAGFGHYWGEVAFFVDATDALFLSRRQRLLQAFAGPATDALLAATLMIAARLLPQGSWTPLLELMALSGWIVVLLNLAPVLKLDGYWAMADFLDQPDLYARSAQALLTVIRGVRDRRTLTLALYAVVSAAAGVGAVTMTVYMWRTYYLNMVTEALSQGIVGVVAVCLFAGPTAAGLITGLAFLARTFAQRLKKSDKGKEVNHETTHAQDQPGMAEAVGL